MIPPDDADAFAAATGATPVQMADLLRYRELLQDWNGRMNLVGPSALASFWPRHAYDSAQLLGLAPDARVWADLGTGAGLPGVVLAILLKGREGARVHLVESLAKRCRFLGEVVAALDLPAEVHNARAEAVMIPEPVDIVTARALAPFARLLGYAFPLLRSGATGLFLKGQGVDEEITEARRSWRFQAELLPSASSDTGRIVKVTGLARA